MREQNCNVKFISHRNDLASESAKWANAELHPGQQGMINNWPRN